LNLSPRLGGKKFLLRAQDHQGNHLQAFKPQVSKTSAPSLSGISTAYITKEGFDLFKKDSKA
jgi:hypothetical protein